jgi:DNA primase
MDVFHPHKVYTYFIERFVLSKPSPKMWYAFDCPFCGGHKKCAVSFQAMYVKCWKCTAASGVSDFVQTIEGCNYHEARVLLNSMRTSSLSIELIADTGIEITGTSDVTLPNGWQSILDGVGSLGDRARRALEKRGFNLEVLDFKGFGYCNQHYVPAEGEDKATASKRDFFGYIIVPFKKDGILAYYIGRDFVGNTMRYKNPPSDWVGIGKSDVIYNEEALHLYKSIEIVEGWSDAEYLGVSGTATLGWNMSNTQLSKYFKSTAKKFTFIPDAGCDTTGRSFFQTATQTAMKFLESGRKLKVLDLNIPEFDSVLTEKGERAKDVCEIGSERIQWLYKRTPFLTWESAMQTLTK